MRLTGGPGGKGLLGQISLSLVLSCGAVSERRGTPAAREGESAVAQSQVPAELQKPGVDRYFLAHDEERGPELVTFADPAAPRVVALGSPPGAYRVSLSEWSPSGRRLVVALTGNEAVAPPRQRVLLFDADTDFVSRELEHSSLLSRALVLAWVGERAIVALTRAPEGAYNDVEQLSWIDVESGGVTALDPLPQTQTPVNAGPAGLLYRDPDCNLSYLERPGHRQIVREDCADAEWSPDGNFALAHGPDGRELYALIDGTLQLLPVFSGQLGSLRTTSFRWAPSGARFALTEGGGRRDDYVSSLAIGDASAGQLSSFTSWPNVNDARFVTPDLLLASDWSGDSYVLDAAARASDAELELQPLGLAAPSDSGLVVSRDASRIYVPKDPFVEIELAQGRPVATNVLFDDPREVASTSFFTLGSARAGLLTTFEPPQGEPGEATKRAHQYLVRWGESRDVTPLGSFQQADGTAARGVRTFQTAPRFGGIFYLSTSARGYAIDWLGFDDISRKRPLIDVRSTNIGVDFPLR